MDIIKMKARKTAKRAFKWLVRNFPQPLKGPVVRSLFRYQYNIDPALEIRIASEPAELMAAMELVHEAYRSEGFVSDSEFIDLNKYLLLPTSTVLVAVHSNKIVGTLTLVKSGALGLPAERAFNLAAAVARVSGKRHRVAEVTCLAVDRSYRRERGFDVLFPLMKFMYEYATQYFQSDLLIVTSRPREADFYREILLFEDLEPRPVHYLGAPAIALFLDLRTAPQRYQAVYQKMTPTRNLHKYFTSPAPKNFIFPKRAFYKSFDSSFSPESVKTILTQSKRFRLPKLAPSEQKLLRFHNLESPVWQSIFPDHADSTNRRHANRVATTLPVVIRSIGEPDAVPVTADTIEVSQTGLRLSAPDNDLTLNGRYELSIAISETISSQLSATIIWQDGDGTVGMRITASDAAWETYINYLRSEYPK